MTLWKPSRPSQPGFDDSFSRGSSPTPSPKPAPVKARDKLPAVPVQPLRRPQPVARRSQDGARQGPHWLDQQHLQEQIEFKRRLAAAVAAGEDYTEAWKRIQREMWP